MSSDDARVTITVVGLPLGRRCGCNPSGCSSFTQSDLNLLELDMKERFGNAIAVTYLNIYGAEFSRSSFASLIEGKALPCIFVGEELVCSGEVRYRDIEAQVRAARNRHV